MRRSARLATHARGVVLVVLVDDNTLPIREQLLQLLVLGQQVRHMRRRGHERGALGDLGRVVLRFRHEVAEVGLHAAQDLDVFFRRERGGLAFGLQLGELVRADGAAFAFGLQPVDFEEEVGVDVEKGGDGGLLGALALCAAGGLRGSRRGGGGGLLLLV